MLPSVPFYQQSTITWRWTFWFWASDSLGFSLHNHGKHQNPGDRIRSRSTSPFPIVTYPPLCHCICTLSRGSKRRSPAEPTDCWEVISRRMETLPPAGVAMDSKAITKSHSKPQATLTVNCVSGALHIPILPLGSFWTLMASCCGKPQVPHHPSGFTQTLLTILNCLLFLFKLNPP